MLSEAQRSAVNRLICQYEFEGGALITVCVRGEVTPDLMLEWLESFIEVKRREIAGRRALQERG